MSIELYNKLDNNIEYAVSDTLDPITSTFIFKPFLSKKPINFKRKDRYIAFKVPAGQGIAINPKSRIIFEFIQAIPKFDEKEYDIYVFQVLKLGIFKMEENGGGDGDIDPPNNDIPIIDK